MKLKGKIEEVPERKKKNKEEVRGIYSQYHMWAYSNQK